MRHPAPSEASQPSWIAVDAGEGSHTFRLVEISATECARADWEAKFWALFPEAPDRLEAIARSAQGIHVTLDVAGPLPSHVKSQYGPYSASKLRRIIQASRSNDPPIPALRAAIEAYQRDYELDDAARKQELLSTLDRLPRPPAGYHWAPDYGGVLHGNLVSFRLWSNAFGYMPHSE